MYIREDKRQMLIVFFRAIILYFVIVISIRLMGKRQIGELQPAELVVTILMSNIATLPIEDINIPMIMGVVPIFTLVCLDVFISGMSMRSRKIRKLFSGTPKIIISDGKVDEGVMRSLRFTVDDLMASLRSAEVFDLKEVQLAVVETTGKISVYQRQSEKPCTPTDMGIKKEDRDPPRLIISDGEILYSELEAVGRDKKWLDGILRQEGCTKDTVLIMTCDEQAVYNIIKKERRK